MNSQLSKETVSLGLPVELGKIDKELAHLWQQGEGVLTRASLINFAVCCQGQSTMAENTALISEFMRSHACRALLFALEPDAPETRVQSWISAHCHVSRAGAKQVCCEQMTFLLEGDARGLIPSIVFSHLDSDLPLYLWWQGDLPRPIDPQLLAWVDRLIFDTGTWSRPADIPDVVRELCAEDNGRMVLCDLNWSRTIAWRRAVMRVFDHPDNLALLSRIEQIRIKYGPGHRTGAALLAGWFIDRLGRKPKIQLSEAPGRAVSQCVLTAINAEFTLKQDPGCEFIIASVRATDGRDGTEILPGSREDMLSLLDEELTRGGRRLLYTKALAGAKDWL